MRKLTYVDREPQGQILEPNLKKFDWVRRCPKCKSTEMKEHRHGKLHCASCKKIIDQFEIYDRNSKEIVCYAGSMSMTVRW